MGNVKRLLQWVSLVLVVLYLTVIVVDDLVIRAHATDAYHHIQKAGLVANEAPVQALIVGGSNAMYGLSAQQMTQQSGLRFYNLALEQEGRSLAAYSDYLQTLSESHVDAKQIRLVVYSSISPLRVGNIDLYQKSNQNISGQVPFSIKPRTDVGRLLKQIKLNWSLKDQLRPDQFGDLDFASEPCDAPLTDIQVETENLDVLMPFFEERVRFLKGLFPNATVLVVIPSEYYAGADLPVEWKKDLTERLSAANLENTHLIIQPPLPKPQWVCEIRHHPDAEGRAWRTSDLISRIKRMDLKP